MKTAKNVRMTLGGKEIVSIGRWGFPPIDIEKAIGEKKSPPVTFSGTFDPIGAGSRILREIIERGMTFEVGKTYLFAIESGGGKAGEFSAKCVFAAPETKEYRFEPVEPES
jgi:hypothetical protein